MRLVAPGACTSRRVRVACAERARTQGMSWSGPGSAPATPDAATIAALARQPGLWAPWDGSLARALQRTHLQLSLRAGWQPGEVHVKSWVVTMHTAAGRQARHTPRPRAAYAEAPATQQVERVLVATDRALYRCAFSYREGKLGESRRCEWSAYAQVHTGPFEYQARGARHACALLRLTPPACRSTARCPAWATGTWRGM